MLENEEPTGLGHSVIGSGLKLRGEGVVGEETLMLGLGEVDGG